MQKTVMTPFGEAALRDELEHLTRVIRPQIVDAIATAREHGDLKENAEYHSAKEKQSFIEGRITELESVLSRAEIIDLSKLDGRKVTFGTTVKVYDEEADRDIKFSIVGPYEANLDKGLISVSSPLAKGLMGKENGSQVEIQTPSGLKNYEILNIDTLK